MDGDGFKEDIITVRPGLRFGAQFYPPYTELLWFKNPGDEASDPNVEWDETILYGGPLVGFQGPYTYVQMHDFYRDGVSEFVATHLFTGFNPATADTGKITLCGAHVGSDWSQVNASDPVNAPQARTKNLVTDHGNPFGIEIVDLNGDGRARRYPFQQSPA